MSIGQTLAAASKRTVRLGPVEFRAHKVSNELLIGYGASIVDFLPISEKRDLIAQARDGGAVSESDAREAVARKLVQHLNAANTEKVLKSTAAMNNACVCAGIREARELAGSYVDGVFVPASDDAQPPWQEVRFVENERDADPDNNILWVGDLTESDRATLASEVMALLREGVEQRLARFRSAG